MPATITPSPVEVEKKHTGGSGRPPTDRKPTGGGGDGDNWNDRPAGKRGPREALAKYRLGLFFALAGDLMFFVAMISAFFVRQSSGHFDAREQWINDWRPVLLPPILWLNTFVLVLSSVTVEMARRRLFHEPDVMEEWFGLGRPAARRAGPWLGATIVLGGLFLTGQVMAWKQLALTGAYFATNPSSHFFYLITVAHAAHLLLGMAALIAAAIGLARSHRLQLRQILLDTSAWYWHVMGVLWLFLFALLEFCQ
jgi:cytochrome c oxidase subunit 3